MVWNPEKCHLRKNSNEKIAVKILEYENENSECEKLLGVKWDWKLNFDVHTSGICKETCRKLNILVRIAPFIELSKRLILMNTFLILNNNL